MDLDVFCSYPFVRVRITAEGNMAMCCFQRDKYIGNLLEDTFDNVWFGELAEAVRIDTIEGKLHPLCQVAGCPHLNVRTPQHVIFSEYPSFLEIDLPNTHCNVGLERPGPTHPACIMCERAGPPETFRPETNRLSEVLPKIIHLLPSLRQIHIQGIAEPFYKDMMFDTLDAIQFDQHRRIIISTTTNGTLFGPAVRKRFLDRCPNSITTFSIDAATPATFQKIRILPVFDKVIENLCEFSAERNRQTQKVRIHNNINIHNVDEVVGMVEIAAKAKVDCIEFNPTDGFNTSLLVNEDNCGRFRRAQLDIVDACRRLKIDYNFIRPLDLGMTDRLVQITL
jgi:molybdenum cofactor biosynthesis enzyme MoaA